MALRKLELEVPEDLLAILGKTSKDVRTEALERLVLSLVRESEITASKGAELLGIPYRTMLELMAAHDVPLLRLSAEEVAQDVKTLNKLLG